jgi:hypothetical protein
MKDKNMTIKKIFYNRIIIMYSSIIAKHKYKEFSDEVLELLNSHIFITAEFALNCYKSWTRFIVESLLSEIGRLMKESRDQYFYMELLIIRALTNKITSHRIQERWTEIINKANMSREEQDKV